MYGTIGFEYAAMNIPVINASLNNPHIAYDFNINPKTRENYQKILKNLKNIKFNQIILQNLLNSNFGISKIFFDNS